MRIQAPETCPMAQNVICFFQAWDTGFRGAMLNCMDCCFQLLKVIVCLIYLTQVSLNTTGVLILHFQSLRINDPAILTV